MVPQQFKNFVRGDQLVTMSDMLQHTTLDCQRRATRQFPYASAGGERLPVFFWQRKVMQKLAKEIAPRCGPEKSASVAVFYDILADTSTERLVLFFAIEICRNQTRPMCFRQDRART